MLQEGDAFKLNYIAVEYDTGKEREAHWEKRGGFAWQYGKGKVVKGWVPGLRGMRVGGRRELIVPSRLAYNSGPLVYVLELIEVR
jgi:peptidylprolyl isomerase